MNLSSAVRNFTIFEMGYLKHYIFSVNRKPNIMKKIISFIVAFNLFGLIWGQDTINNFYAEDNDIIWQKVYETNFTFDQLVTNISESGLLHKIYVSSNKITGDLKPFEVDFKGAGYSRGLTPMYLLGSLLTGFVAVDFKDGKYRVTIVRINYEYTYSTPLWKQGDKSSLSSVVLKRNNVMKEAFKGDGSIILNYTFSKKFDLKPRAENQNW